jgi:hypothetical protein
MGGFGHGVAVAAQEVADAVQQLAPARHDARHVLKDDEFGGLVFPSFKGKPDASERQCVQGLVLAALADGFREKPRESFARRGQEDDVRALTACGTLEILRCCFSPAYWRLVAVEGDVLLAGKEVEAGAFNTC